MNLPDARAAVFASERSIVYIIRGRPGPNDRQPLPAGHPDTWGALTRGTILEGAAYPNPPILDRRDDAAWRAILAQRGVDPAR